MPSLPHLLAVASMLLACATACTAPPPPPKHKREPKPEPTYEPPPEPVRPEPIPEPAPGDYGEYVEIPGGHGIPTLSFKRTEVTVAEYRECYRRGACRKPDEGEWCNWGLSDREQHPVNCVSWHQASDYCRWAGGRLPTEWEWEWAAQGREAARPYPWGRAQATCARAVMSAGGPGCGTDATWPVASKPSGASIDGLHDMAGNVFEWTSTIRTDVCGSMATIKGGSMFIENPRRFRVDFGLASTMNGQSFGDGIRCVRDLRSD